jgi:hypothetical protein
MDFRAGEKMEPAKELAFQGVYKIDKKGNLSFRTTESCTAQWPGL